MAFTLQKGAQPHWPELFRQIIRNDADQARIFELGSSMTRIDWCQLKILRAERAEYRRGAEKALKWNQDKGNTA
jgi:hypothetical protein